MRDFFSFECCETVAAKNLSLNSGRHHLPAQLIAAHAGGPWHLVPHACTWRRSRPTDVDMTEIALVTNVGACRVGLKAALLPRLRFRCPSLHAGYRLTDNKYSQSSASVLFVLPGSPLTQFLLIPSKYACLYLQLVVKQTYETTTQLMFKHCFASRRSD